NPRLLRLPDHNTRIEQINPAASACAPAPGVALEQVHTSSGHSETLEQVDPEPLSVLLLLPGEPLSLPLVELPQPVGLKRVETGLHRPPIRTGVNASVHAHNLARARRQLLNPPFWEPGARSNCAASSVRDLGER